jgi:hypothetical protein
MQTVRNGDQLNIRDAPVLIFNAGNDALGRASYFL